ncbi:MULTISPECIES: HypC/HybG/HupF family hydrogenase formation chaperone [unclassified Legionella]|nr:HypC/HybG/HupF family hydrogenase formation chaperone [Legionella sp. 31fI33]MCC5015136.1 HypC/HybG/HupF family hydrogenase formation chaperone [Legionella sp. 31fI33]
MAGWKLQGGGINMCLALPAQVVRLLDSQRALVNIGGIEKEISLALVEQVSEGDYVILHVGYALTRLDEEEAKKTLMLFAEMQEAQ